MFSLKSVNNHPVLNNSTGNATVDETFADVWIKGKSGERVKTHRFMLGAVSPLLWSVLHDIPALPDICVIVPETSEATVKQLTRFIRCEQLTVAKRASYMRLLELMQLLDVDYVNRCTVTSANGVTDLAAIARKAAGKKFQTPKQVNSFSERYNSFSERYKSHTETNSSRGGNSSVSGGGGGGRPGAESPKPFSKHADYRELNDNAGGAIVNDDQVRLNCDRAAVANNNEPLAAEQKTFSPSEPSASDDHPTILENQFCFLETLNDAMPDTLTKNRHDATAHKGESPTGVSESQIHSCQFCDKSFSTADHLHKHVKKFHSYGHLKCEKCSYSTNYKQSLKQHVQIVHEKIFNYECAECSRKFSTKANLNIHKKRIHLNMKPFGCDCCSAAFSRRGDLLLHTRTHTGEKPFACVACGRSYSNNSSLRTHKCINSQSSSS